MLVVLVRDACGIPEHALIPLFWFSSPVWTWLLVVPLQCGAAPLFRPFSSRRLRAYMPTFDMYVADVCMSLALVYCPAGAVLLCDSRRVLLVMDAVQPVATRGRTRLDGTVHMSRPLSHTLSLSRGLEGRQAVSPVTQTHQLNNFF